MFYLINYNEFFTKLFIIYLIKNAKLSIKSIFIYNFTFSTIAFIFLFSKIKNNLSIKS